MDFYFNVSSMKRSTIVYGRGLGCYRSILHRTHVICLFILRNEDNFL